MEMSGARTYVNERTPPENNYTSHGGSDFQEDGSNVYDDIGVTLKSTADGGGPVSKRSVYKAAVVSLSLLRVLLLAGIIGLGVHYIRVIEDKTRETEERDQLQIKYEQLQTKYDNLTRERHQQDISYKNLTRERHQQDISYKNLTRERDDLQKRLCEELPCPANYTKFGCSYYYVSTETKTWNESRQDCQQRGADLVVVNNTEEQEFLLTFNKYVWIGLTDRDVEGTWTWVDGTPLTTAYWYRGQPNGGGGEDCAVINSYSSDPENSWHDYPCGHHIYWVCERGI